MSGEGGGFKQAWALYETTVYVYILSNCSSAVYSVFTALWVVPFP